MLHAGQRQNDKDVDVDWVDCMTCDDDVSGRAISCHDGRAVPLRRSTQLKTGLDYFYERAEPEPDCLLPVKLAVVLRMEEKRPPPLTAAAPKYPPDPFEAPCGG